MRKMLRCALALFACAALLLAACSPAPSEASASHQVISGGEMPAAGSQIALLGTGPQLESQFGQSAWNAISRFAGEENMAANLYTLDEDPALAQTTLEIAVKGGAGVLVLFGENMAEFARKAAHQHTGMDIILLDAPEAEETPPLNMIEVRFDLMQAGWMAGWAAVAEGALSLAYMETEQPNARRYALGFVLGAEAAAVALDVETIRMMPCWTSAEAEDEALQNQVEYLAAQGVELFFANLPDKTAALLRAARKSGARVIGVDQEPDELDETLFSSTRRAPRGQLYQLLEHWNQGTFPGGQSLECGIEQEAAALVVEAGYFTRFDEEDYQAARQAFLAAGGAPALAGRIADAGALEGTLPAPWALALTRVYFSSATGNQPVAASAGAALSGPSAQEEKSAAASSG